MEIAGITLAQITDAIETNVDKFDTFLRAAGSIHLSYAAGSFGHVLRACHTAVGSSTYR